jgi:hypothetical protein
MSQTFTSDAPTTTTNIFTDNQNSRTNENTLRSNFSGTSFPDNPVAGQKCWRTDKGKEYVYNGTSWIEPDSVSTVGEDVILSYGEMDSLYDRLAVSINDDGTLKTDVTANISEWIIPSWAPTYISSTSFTVSGDYTGVLTVNRMIKGVLDSSVVYSYITSSEYSSDTSLTTVTINDAVLTSELTAIHYSVIQKTTAEGIVNTPSGNISATNVQDAIDELDSEKAALSGATFTGPIVGAVGDSIASAATLDLSAATGQIVHVTGTTAITAVTMTKGQWCEVIWDNSLTLTHSATANNLPGEADITTETNDRSLYYYDGSVVYCMHYQRADGTAISGGGGAPDLTDYIVSGRTFTVGDDLNLTIASGVDYISNTKVSREENTLALTASRAQLVYDTKAGASAALVASFPDADSGTVGRWVIDGSSSIANSAVGENDTAVTNNLTSSGTVSQVTGWANDSAAKVAGAGYYYAANSTNFPSGANSREVNAVFTVNKISTSLQGYIFSYGAASTSAIFGLCIGTDGGLLLIGGSNDLSTGYIVEVGKTYFVTAQYDGTYGYLYVNGRLVYKGAWTISTTLTYGMYIGTYFGSTTYNSYCTLHYLDLRSALSTSAQIAANSNALLLPCGKYDEYSGSYPTLSDSSYYEYKFSESSGSTVADSKGSLAGTATGTTIVSSEIISGGYARYFDGSDDKVASSSTVTFGSAFTMIAVFNPTNFSTARPILGNYYSGGNYLMAYTNGKVALGSDSSTVYSSATTGSGKPNFAAAVVSGGQATLYVNSPYADSTSAYTYNTNSNVMYIGYAYTGSSLYFKGTIDYCLYVPRALSQTEMATIYNALMETETRDILYNLPDDSISLGFARTNATAIIVKNDTDYQYGRREGAVDGNRCVFLGWQYFSGSVALTWPNPFGTRKIRTYYTWAQDSKGTNECEAATYSYDSAYRGLGYSFTTTQRITMTTMVGGVCWFNSAWQTSGYIGCYAEVIE